MAVALSPLLTPLTRAEGADLDATDERLVSIDALSEKGRYDAAARAVEELVGEGIYDIRPLPYLLYQAFVEDGFAGLVTVLAALENLLGPSFSALSPERRRAEYVNKRLAWLFETIQRSLEYHQKFTTAEWRTLCARASPSELDQAREAATRLLERLEGPENASAATALGQLLVRLRDCESAVAVAMEEAAAPSAPGARRESSRPAPPSSNALNGNALSSEPPSESGLYRMELWVGHPFVELCKKLKAFELLVEKRQFQKAAVLAADIAAAVDAFDPRVHFPELFARYAALESRHAAILADEAQARESPVWRALAQYSRVDLVGFVEG